MKSNLSQLLKTSRHVKQSVNLAESIIETLPWQPPLQQDQDDGDRLLARIRASASSRAETLRFFYTGSIVSIYGALEQFVESLAVEAVERIANACPSYDDLPRTLLKSHETLTAEVLTRMLGDRYYGPLQKRDLIAGLQQTDAAYLPVRVNRAVFGVHSANCKWQVIRQIFERAGINLAALETNQTFNTAIQTYFPDSGTFFVIDDLAQRRNEVAHGWEGNVLSPELIINYVEVVESFARGLLEIVISEVSKLVIKHVGKSLGRPDKLFQHCIAGYTGSAHALEVGDYVAILGETVKCVPILELQSDNITVNSVEVGDSVGVRLSSNISQRNRLFLLPKDSGYLQA